MAEPEESAGRRSGGEVKAAVNATAGAGADDDAASATAAGAEDLDAADSPKTAEPPRRRLVSELLEGQEVLEESSRSGLQLVAPPLHFETIDAGQPIYQLDLSSEEPQGTIVEPERPARPHEDAPVAAPGGQAWPVDGDAREIVKHMVKLRDRQIMAAERDGIAAYELATDVDTFVGKIIEVVCKRG